MRIATYSFVLVALSASSVFSQQSTRSDTALIPAQLLNAREAGAEVTRWYPDRLRELGIGGIAVLKLKVNAEGKITRREVYASSGVRGFDRAAMRVSEMLKLQPATRGGVPVESEVRVPIRFEGNHREGVIQLTKASLLTRDSAVATATSSFPKVLRSRALNAYTSVALEVSADGLVRDAFLIQSSCFPDADDVALRVARHLRFAHNSGIANRGHLNVTFAFQNDSVKLTVVGDTAIKDSVSAQGNDPQSRRRAELINREDVQRAVIKQMPRELRDKGVGAQVIVSMRLDEQGKVVRREVANTSGSCAADLAALEVASVARFTPALVDGNPQRIWIQLPIVFRMN